MKSADITELYLQIEFWKDFLRNWNVIILFYVMTPDMGILLNKNRAYEIVN